jgi:hypothetical protein
MTSISGSFFFFFFKEMMRLGKVTRVCNSSYSGGQEDDDLKPVGAKSLQEPIKQ